MTGSVLAAPPLVSSLTAHPCGLADVGPRGTRLSCFVDSHGEFLGGVLDERGVALDPVDCVCEVEVRSLVGVRGGHVSTMDDTPAVVNHVLHRSPDTRESTTPDPSGTGRHPIGDAGAHDESRIEGQA
jgi:hypothetical protein